MLFFRAWKDFCCSGPQIHLLPNRVRRRRGSASVARLGTKRFAYVAGRFKVLDCIHFLMGRLDALGELHGHECYFVDPENALILIKGDVFLQSVETGSKTLVVLTYGATVDGYVVVNPSYAGDTR